MTFRIKPKFESTAFVQPIWMLRTPEESRRVMAIAVLQCECAKERANLRVRKLISEQQKNTTL